MLDGFSPLFRVQARGQGCCPFHSLLHLQGLGQCLVQSRQNNTFVQQMVRRCRGSYKPPQVCGVAPACPSAKSRAVPLSWHLLNSNWCSRSPRGPSGLLNVPLLPPLLSSDPGSITDSPFQNVTWITSLPGLKSSHCFLSLLEPNLYDFSRPTELTGTILFLHAYSLLTLC